MYGNWMGHFKATDNVKNKKTYMNSEKLFTEIKGNIKNC